MFKKSENTEMISFSSWYRNSRAEVITENFKDFSEIQD